MAYPLRIFFINCPTLDVDAASYLLLAQNKNQSHIQFQVNHFWLCTLGTKLSFRSSLSRFLDRLPSSISKRISPRIIAKFDLAQAPQFKRTLGKQTWERAATEAISNWDAWFKTSDYHKHDSQPCRSIVVTETPLKGGYISYAGEEIFFISLANWEAYFSPGSALEFLLLNVQRASLRLALNAKGWHFATRGCLNDFGVHQPDTRISAYLGGLCQTCQSKLVAATSSAVAAEMELFLANRWIGVKSDPTSVASVLSNNYKYELRRSTGLRPSLWHTTKESMRNEFGKEVVGLFKYSLVIAATIFLYKYLPEFYKIIKGK